MSELSRYHRTQISEEGTDSLSAVLRRVPAGARVLDLGCSTGGLAAALQAKGCEVTGVDVMPADVAEASARVRRVLVADLDVDDLLELLPGESFDVVVAADVLEHLRDPERALRQCRDLLGPGGTLVFSIPNVAHASVRLALWGGEFPYEDTGILDRTHLRMFTLRSVQDLLSATGFELMSLGRTSLALERGVPHRASAVPRKVLAEMLRDPEALTLQFVGSARPTGPRAPLPQRPPRTAEGPDRQLVREQARLLADRDCRLAQLESVLARRQRRLHRRLVRRVTRRMPWVKVLFRAVRNRSQR